MQSKPRMNASVVASILLALCFTHGARAKTTATTRDETSSQTYSPKASFHADIDVKALRSHQVGEFLLRMSWLKRIIDRFDYEEWTGDEFIPGLDRAVIYLGSRKGDSERAEFLIRYEFREASKLHAFLTTVIPRDELPELDEKRDESDGEWISIEISEQGMNGLIRYRDRTIELGDEIFFEQPGDQLLSDSVAKQWTSLPDAPLRIAMDDRIIQPYFRQDVQSRNAQDLALDALTNFLHMDPNADTSFLRMYLFHSISQLDSLGFGFSPSEDPIATIAIRTKDQSGFAEMGHITETLVGFLRFSLQQAILDGGDDTTEVHRLQEELSNGIRISQNSESKEWVVTIRQTLGINEKIERLLATGSALAIEQQDSNRLKMVAIAIHNYLDVHKRLPFKQRDERISDQLSWRVHLLPYLERYRTWDQLDLGKPWDAEPNRSVLVALEKEFRLSDDSLISFVVPERIPITEQAITDGLSNTIMAIADPTADEDHWSKPQDITIAEAVRLLRSLGDGDSILVAFYDASVVRIGSVAGLSDQEVENLFDPSDGNEIRTDVFESR